MALNWNVKENANAYREISKEEFESEEDKNSLFQCPKYEEDGKYYQMNIECNMLILVCGLAIGIPEINQDNYEQVFNRISVLESLNGTFLKSTNPQTKESFSVPFTIEMVKNNIGIKTNGITLTRSEFEKKVLGNVLGDKKI